MYRSRFGALVISLFAACAILSAKPSAAEETPTEEAAAMPNKQFVYVLHLVPRLYDDAAWTEADAKAVGAHFVRLQEAAKEGRVILAGKTDEPAAETFGLVIFEAKDADAARAFMDEDPAVVAGVMTADLHPYAVAILRDPK